MADKLGTKNVEELLALGKIAVMAVLREISRDGFQPRDLGAFLKSNEFEAALQPALEGIDQVLLELSDLGFTDYLRLARSGYTAIEEILGELKTASSKVKKQGASE